MVIANVSTLAAVIPVEANATPAPEPSLNVRLITSVTPLVNATLANV